MDRQTVRWADSEEIPMCQPTYAVAQEVMTYFFLYAVFDSLQGYHNTSILSFLRTSCQVPLSIRDKDKEVL